MKLVDADSLRKEIEFAERAAKQFEQNAKINTFTDGEIKAGELFALRWGLHGRAIVVMRISKDHDPVIYGDIVPYNENQKGQFA